MPRERKLPKGMQKRGDIYYAAFRVNGKLVRRKLSADYQAALRMLNELRARADQADFGLLDNNYPIEQLKKDWLKHCEQSLRKRTVQRYRENLAVILPATGFANVRSVSVQAVLVFRADQLSKGTSPRTVNMMVGALSAMLNWGVAHKLFADNRLAKVKPLSNEKPRKVRRTLSVDEVLRVFDHSPDYLKPVWRIFMTTGIRHNELAEMRFDDIDYDRRVVTVRGETSKNREAREIPLDDETLEMLEALRSAADDRQVVTEGPQIALAGYAKNFSRDHVFVTQANTPWRNHLLDRFYAVCKRADIPDAHPGGSVDIHSLRGSFITLSLESGATPKAVQSIVGHKTLRMTMDVYAKATDQAKRSAVAALPFAKVSTPDHVVPLEKARQRESGANVRNRCASVREGKKPGRKGIA